MNLVVFNQDFYGLLNSVLVIGLVGRLIGAIQLGGRQLRRKWANRTNSTVAAYSDTWPSNRARRVQAVDSAVLLHRKSAGIRCGIAFSDDWTSKVWSAMEASGRLKMKLLRWGAFSSGLGCIQGSLQWLGWANVWACIWASGVSSDFSGRLRNDP